MFLVPFCHLKTSQQDQPGDHRVAVQLNLDTSKARRASSPRIDPSTEDQAVLGVHFDLGWEWVESAGGVSAGLVDLH